MLVTAAACAGAAREAPPEQAMAPRFAALMQPTTAAELIVEGRRDQQIIVACDLAPPQLSISTGAGDVRSGAISARDCRAIWQVALLIADSGGCTVDEFHASACIRAVDHERTGRACCAPGANPIFDAAIRDFTIAAERTPTHVAVAP